MLTPDDIHILHHSLGMTYGEWYEGSDKPATRNYYCVEPGDPQCERLVSLGLMKRSWAPRWMDRLIVCKVTERGEELARQELPKPPSRAKRRYMKYLNVCDCLPDLTFKEFITNPEFKECW